MFGLLITKQIENRWNEGSEIARKTTLPKFYAFLKVMRRMRGAGPLLRDAFRFARINKD